MVFEFEPIGARCT